MKEGERDWRPFGLMAAGLVGISVTVLVWRWRASRTIGAPEDAVPPPESPDSLGLSLEEILRIKKMADTLSRKLYQYVKAAQIYEQLVKCAISIEAFEITEELQQAAFTNYRLAGDFAQAHRIAQDGMFLPEKLDLKCKVELELLCASIASHMRSPLTLDHLSTADNLLSQLPNSNAYQAKVQSTYLSVNRSWLV